MRDPFVPCLRRALINGFVTTPAVWAFRKGSGATERRRLLFESRVAEKYSKEVGTTNLPTRVAGSTAPAARSENLYLDFPHICSI